MPSHVFSIPARGCPASAQELNQFLRTRRVVSVERQLVTNDGNAYWTFCIGYLDRGAITTPSGVSKSNQRDKSKIDYREILSASEFSVFSKLRDLRKEIAAAEAVPVYAIFTNEQLAAFVRTNAKTKNELRQVAGVGESRLEKYGDRIIECLCAMPNSTVEKES